MKKLFLFSFFLLPFFVFAQAHTGKIIYVSDGDTFHFVEMGKSKSDKIRVRLAEVDCPETTQPFGLEAKEFVMNKVLNKPVVLRQTDIDQYGRMVAEVHYSPDKNLAQELLSNGLAWHFVRYSDNENYAKLEVYARENKLGLFSDSNPIAPWDWRRGKR